MSFLKILTRAACALTALGLCLPAEAQEVGSYAVFNDPTSNLASERNAITDHIIELIDNTPSGAWIRVGAYSFSRTDVKWALVSAVCRGVVVRVVVDEYGQHNHDGTECDWDFNSSNKCVNLDNLFGPEGLAWFTWGAFEIAPEYCQQAGVGVSGPVTCPSCSFTRCGYGHPGQGCISNHSGSIQHQKYMMFSTTYHPVTNAKLWRTVLVSSSNLTYSAANDQWNNAVVTHGDKPWYDAWVDHFNRQRAENKLDDYYQPTNSPPLGYYQSQATYYTAFYSPNQAGDGDLVAERLVAERLPGDGQANDNDCLLWANHASLNDGRAEVLEQLVRVAYDEGCDVRILYDHFSLAWLFAIYGIPTAHANDGSDFTHHKYIIYRGRYDGVADKSRVWTGSHNLTVAALEKHDEVLLKIGTRSMFDAFRHNFCQMWPLYDNGNYPIPLHLCN